MKVSSQLVEDVQSLLEKTVLEEATAVVWTAFEHALEKLDEQSLSILRMHFNGTPLSEISKAKGIPPEAADAWLKKVKRELMEELRRDSKVRQ